MKGENFLKMLKKMEIIKQVEEKEINQTLNIDNDIIIKLKKILISKFIIKHQL